MNKTSLVATLALLVGVGTLSAAGFGLYEITPRGNAMGGALVGRTGDASSVYFNPANMTQEEGTSILMGSSLIAPRATVDIDESNTTGAGVLRADKADLDSKYFLIPSGFITSQVSERIWLGFGNYTEYGMGTEYDPTNYSGRYNALYSELKTVTFSPTIAFKATERLSLGAGLRIMYIQLKHARALPGAGLMPATDGRMKVTADDISLGYLLSASYAATDDLDIGLVYRSRIDHKLHGEGKIDYANAGERATSDGFGKITLPASLTGGINYQITSKWSVGTALTWTEWSTFDNLTLVFDDAILPGIGGNHSENTDEKKWKDVYRLGLGTEYKFDETWAVQGSYTYDMAPNNSDYADFLIPPGDRHLLGAGVTYTTGDWSFGFGYAFLMMFNGDGTAKTLSTGVPALDLSSEFDCGFAYSHILSASVGFTF